MSDILTKKVPKPQLMEQCKHVLWEPNFHLLHHNRLSEDVVEA